MDKRLALVIAIVILLVFAVGVWTGARSVLVVDDGYAVEPFHYGLTVYWDDQWNIVCPVLVTRYGVAEYCVEIREPGY